MITAFLKKVWVNISTNDSVRQNFIIHHIIYMILILLFNFVILSIMKSLMIGDFKHLIWY